MSLSYLLIKKIFFEEIKFLSQLGYSAWLIGGDFNLLWKISEEQGKSFNYIVSKCYNTIIHDLQMVELTLSDRKYTWSRSVSSHTFTLLDRFLCTVSWQQHYLYSFITSLSRVSSDHNPLVLHSSSFHVKSALPIRFEKE
jgi:hypothetical protein